MRVFDFDHAIVREPSRSVADGIRSDPAAKPDYAAVAREHAAYVAALMDAGLRVDVLPALEAYPDSVFVEDPALVFPEGAILLRPGAAARLGEAEEMRSALRRHFDTVLELADDEHADGGDVLVTPDVVFIGMSQRTNRRGAEALSAALAQLGHRAEIVKTPEPILHFKTACSLLDEETMLVTRQMRDNGVFAGFRMIVTPDGEEAAANALRVNETVLASDAFPRTIDLLRSEGLTVLPLPTAEIAKLDAGLSCMSLRWMQRR